MGPLQKLGRKYENQTDQVTQSGICVTIHSVTTQPLLRNATQEAEVVQGA